MQPAAVEAFVSAFHREINQERAASEALRSNVAIRHATISKKLDGLYEAIADGLRSPGLLAKLESLEAEKADLEQDLAEPAPSAVRLHPDLAGAYRRKVEDLGAALNDPAIRDEALPILRGLIEAVRLTKVNDGWKVKLERDICAMIDLGTASDRSTKAEAIASPDSIKRSTKVVAGAGFDQERTLPRLSMAV